MSAESSMRSEVERLQAELARLKTDCQQREAELARVNQELTETNSGVLALYDELDTLHRVGLALAERHNLHDLLQTIVDATTELTGAELGAFYHHEALTGAWRMNAFSGSQRTILAQLPAEHGSGFFGQAPDAHAVQMMHDLRAVAPEEVPAPPARWLAVVAERYPVRSCLYVPVLMNDTELAGVLIFGHARPAAFTERSERIVTSIAVQAAVGIERARLFHGLQTASEAKDRFLAMLSHELRTPLNPVTAILASLSTDAELPERYRDEVQLMRRNIDLEARLIDDLLDFNRIIRGKLQLHRSSVEVHALVRAAAQICEEDLQDRAHTLRLELGATRTYVFGDAARLQQVLWNLLKNATKFTPHGGTITVSSANEGEALVLSVVDTGCGIQHEVLGSIFSAFDQGGLQPGRLGGLGLGLAIAKTFVDLHGGALSAQSDGAGQGATFVLRLPLLPEGERAEVQPDAPLREAMGAPSSRRILLVDDHPDTLQTLARLLTRRGHTVATAANAADALARAAAEPFDVVISDIGLPDRSGLELIAELRRTRHLPAIALSGYAMEEDLASSQAAGFALHLVKPVNFSLLEQAIEDLCE